MALPNKLQSARLTNDSIGDTIDNGLGASEKATADIIGIPIDTLITAAMFTVATDGSLTDFIRAKAASNIAGNSGPGIRIYDTAGEEYLITSENDEFRVYHNSGTEAAPTWDVVFRFDSKGRIPKMLELAGATSLNGLRIRNTSTGDEVAIYINAGGELEIRENTGTQDTPVWTARQVMDIGTGLWQTQPSLHACCALSGVVSIPNNSPTVVPFGSEDFDTSNMHDTVTNNSRVTIPETGYYTVTGTLSFLASSNGYRAIYLRRNGSTAIISIPTCQFSADSVTDQILSVHGFANFSANDYIEMIAYQDSGAALSGFTGVLAAAILR